MLRLTQEEPSDAMSWQAEAKLQELGNPKITQTLRTLDLTDGRVQVLALAGIAFLPTDRPKGIALLRRAIDEDSDSDGSDDSAIDFVYQLAVTDAVEQGKPAEAINLLRTRARRAVNADPSLAIFALFGFRADQNFVDGLDDDAAEFSASLGRPELIYALGRIERIKDDGSNLLAACGPTIHSCTANFNDSGGRPRRQKEINDTIFVCYGKLHRLILREKFFALSRR